MTRRILQPLAVLALFASLAGGGAAAAVPAAKPVPKLARRDVLAAARYSGEHQGLSMIVWQHGRTLLERYEPGTSPADRNRLASITKNVWALVAAIGVGEKWLRYDEPVADTITEWKGQKEKSKIEVRQLLSMSSGLDPGYALIDDAATADKLRAALELPAVAAPGTTFTYGPANMGVFGELLRRKLAARRETPGHFVARRVLRPLGIAAPDWRTDAAGNPMMAAGAYMTARDLLALGRVVLRGGTFHGRRIVPRGAVVPLFEPSPVNPMYGLTFWLNRGAAAPDAVEVDVEQVLGTGAPFDGWTKGCFSRHAPPDMIVMLGSYNQRVYVMASLDLIVVRQGSGTDFKDADFLGLLFGAAPGGAAPSR